MRLLAIDPGKTTGWAIYSNEAELKGTPPRLQRMDETSPPEKFYELMILGSFGPLNQIVIEDYKIRPTDLTKGWGHEWNNGPALQVIGAVELWAQMNHLPVYRSQPANLPTGCKYIGYPYDKKKHTPNRISAIAHGAFWLVKNKICVPPDLRMNVQG